MHRTSRARKAGSSRLCCPLPISRRQAPSLSITNGEDGRILFKCHAGCTQHAVLEALRARRLWPPDQQRNAATQRHTAYTYVDEKGKTLHRTICTSDKRFWQE